MAQTPEEKVALIEERLAKLRDALSEPETVMTPAGDGLGERKPRKRGGGKYAHVIESLPRMFTTEGDYQQRIDTMKARMFEVFTVGGETLDSTKLAYLYHDVRTQRDALDDELSEVNLRLEALSQMLANEFDAAGISTVKLENGASVQSYSEPHSVVVDKEALRQWCISNGYEREMVLPWMKTNAIAKERLLEGEIAPAGVEIIARPKVVFKGAK